MEQLTAGNVQNATSSYATSAGDLLADTLMRSISRSNQQVGVLVTKTFHFSAAHHLPNHNGKCRNPHGHNYDVEVTATGPLITSGSETGMVKDFGNITKDVAGIIMIHDHRDLNEVFANPTAEVLALAWLQDLRRLDPRYISVTVWETDDCFATASISQ